MTQHSIKFIMLSAMLLGLPLLGIWVAGYPLAQYLEFPPSSRYVTHSPFSLAVFSGYTLFILSITVPPGVILVRALKNRNAPKITSTHTFPMWGWMAVISGVVTWVIAWTRFACFSGIQNHTFVPLWISFIVVVNAMTFKRTGRCMITHQTRLFVVLFPVSALFWWFFEYLNRFVQNWFYSGVQYGPGTYLILATLSFSTVLPAVLGVAQWIESFPWTAVFKKFPPVQLVKPRYTAGVVLLVSGLGLTGIGVWPNILFPLLWVSPLLIILSFQTLAGERTILSEIPRGDWSRLIPPALAALICGWFWEMWNWRSLMGWEYAVPFVHRFQLFKMPILGYAGYLPFGLECMVIGEMIKALFRPNNTSS
jgi:hypothetical protein